MIAITATPQTVRTGWNRIDVLIFRKKGENGSAESRLKAQVWREAATTCTWESC